MRRPDFTIALELISGNHSTELIINHCKPNQVPPPADNPTLHIRNCCASVVDKLHKEGYALSMDNGLLSINKY